MIWGNDKMFGGFKKIRTFAADNKCSTNYVGYEENTTIVIAFSNSGRLYP